MRSLIIIGVAVATLAACSAEPAAAPQVPPSTVASTATKPPVDSGKSQRDMDDRLCADLARTGEPYYTNVYKFTSHGQQVDVAPISMTAWTSAMSTIGADQDEIDGTKNIVQASPKVRDAMLALTREALRAGQHFADVAARGATPNSDLHTLDRLFPMAIVACGGHSRIRWFETP